MKKYRAHDTMQALCRRTADSLRFLPPRIPHAVTVIVMALAFLT